MKRLAPIRLFGLFVAGMIAAAAAPAQPTSVRPVQIVVPYPAGGPSDVTARILQGPLARELGEPVIVENVVGISGALAAQKVLGSAADGHTLLLGSPNELILSPLALSTVRLRAEDFRLVQTVAEAVIVLIARHDLGVSSVDALAALARARHAEGRPLTYGTVGIGSIYHLIMEDLQARAGATMTHVPYRSTPLLLQDVAGGHLDVTAMAYSAIVTSLAEQGRLNVLAQLGAQRSALLPGVPAVAEDPALGRFGYAIWAGLLTPRGTPEPVVERLHAAIGRALHDPSVRAQLLAQTQLPAAPIPLTASANFFEAETSRYRTIARRIHLHPQ